ncbi:MAG TPA: hypothetical protein VF411_07840 [Bacteroidia bacterium]
MTSQQETNVQNDSLSDFVCLFSIGTIIDFTTLEFKNYTLWLKL